MSSTSGSIWDFLNNLKRYPAEGKIAGICAGLAKSTPVPVWVWRVLFLISLPFGLAGLFIYIVLWVFMPVQQGETKV